MHGAQAHPRLGGQLLRRDVSEQPLHLGERRRGVDVAGDHEERVVRRVPGVVEALQHARRGLLERGPGAERRVLVGRAGEHARAQLLEQHVARLGEVLRDLLLDRAALPAPLLGGVEHRAQAQRLDVQRHVEVLRGHRKEVLRQALAGVGVEIAADDAADVGELIGRETRAAAEHHVLLGVRRSRKAPRGFVGADEVVHRGRDHRGESVAHDDDLQAVRQRRAPHPAAAARGLVRARAREGGDRAAEEHHHGERRPRSRARVNTMRHGRSRSQEDRQYMRSPRPPRFATKHPGDVFFASREGRMGAVNC